MWVMRHEAQQLTQQCDGLYKISSGRSQYYSCECRSRCDVSASPIMSGDLAQELTVSELFKPIHPPNTLENNLPSDSFKGLVDPKEAAKVGLL